MNGFIKFFMLLLPVALPGCFTQYAYYRTEPSSIEHGRYQWLSIRYKNDVLHKYLNLGFDERERYFASLLQEHPDGRLCLTNDGALIPLKDAPAHCVLLWFPEAPSWTRIRRIEGVPVEIREFIRHDSLWHVFVSSGRVIDRREHVWETPIPTYWEVHWGDSPQPELLLEAREGRRRERERVREQLLHETAPPSGD